MLQKLTIQREKKPSDFTITVSGKSHSPKSFSGSSSGTSATLKAGKYKVTGSGPTGYNIAYSSGCFGTASGGVPIKCTISPSFSTSITIGGSNSTSTTTKTKGNNVDARLQIVVYNRANCNFLVQCPDYRTMGIDVFNDKLVKDGFNGPRCGSSAGCSIRHDVPVTVLHL